MNNLLQHNDKNSLLQDITELEFAAIELTLYLDNHPNNKRALCDYNYVTIVLKELKDKYNKKFGQLSHFGSSEVNNYPWAWASGPWPWE